MSKIKKHRAALSILIAPLLIAGSLSQGYFAGKARGVLVVLVSISVLLLIVFYRSAKEHALSPRKKLQFAIEKTFLEWFK